MKKDIKHVTILHSNDIHANFLAKERNGVLYGGAPKLYEYIENVRAEENTTTFYLVAGDLFTGGMMDTRSQGEDSVRIMNKINPDACSLGNHSVDYGVDQLMELKEKVSTFPLVNANLYRDGVHLFEPYRVIEKDGLKVLVIGVVTDAIKAREKKDPELAKITVEDPCTSITKVCEELGDQLSQFDLRIVLSHIGYDQDVELANALDSKWGIDLIVGGHSHTDLDGLTIENDVMVVQAGKKTKQIGRLNLEIDVATHRILGIEEDMSDAWKIVKLNSKTIDKNPEMKKKVLKKESVHEASLKKEFKIDANQVLATLPLTLTQDCRYQESNLGNFFADILREEFELDIATVGSGSIREEEIGPRITFKALYETFNLNKVYYKILMTEEQLKKACEVFLTKAPYGKEDEGEYFQFSKDVKVHYNKNGKEGERVDSCQFPEKKSVDDTYYTVGIEDFHFLNLEKRFDIKPEELKTFIGKDGVERPYEVLTDFMFKTVWKHLEKHQARYKKSKKEDYDLQDRTLRE